MGLASCLDEALGLLDSVLLENELEESLAHILGDALDLQHSALVLDVLSEEFRFASLVDYVEGESTGLTEDEVSVNDVRDVAEWGVLSTGEDLRPVLDPVGWAFVGDVLKVQLEVVKQLSEWVGDSSSFPVSEFQRHFSWFILNLFTTLWYSGLYMPFGVIFRFIK